MSFDISDIEEIVKGSLKRLSEESEHKRLAVLNVLHANIDVLVKSSDSWFGKKVPDEFKEVIYSLLSLASMYDETDYNEILLKEKFEEVDLKRLLDSVINEFNSINKFRKIILIISGDEFHAFTSKKYLRESMHQILFSFYIFMQDESEYEILLKKEQANVSIELLFKNLSVNFPGTFKIQKDIFAYQESSNYKIGVGISQALVNLNNIGSMVNSGAAGDRSYSVRISFPSIKFLKAVEEVRKNLFSLKSPVKKRGELILLVQDIMLEMLLRELMIDVGYDIKKMDLAGLVEIKEPIKAVIVDYSFLKKEYSDVEIFVKYAASLKKVIIIYAAEDPIVKENLPSNIIGIKKPFEIDAIIDIIERS
ncbi:MAG: hypothetical protein MUD12_08670 [Spirochaetes bacterium]|jgi:hypothetical protein|nr:hypothetical protein [Spirochaetota bacterium]